jgi:arginine N-succinyltransferase
VPSRNYLLVLDAGDGTVQGTSALYSHVGSPYGFFSYKRLRLVQRSQAVDVSCNVEMLALANDYTGTTEVGTLAIHPSLKGTRRGTVAGAGTLYAGRDPARLVCAAVDGRNARLAGRSGENPFWNAVGARFFSMDFATADRLSATRGADFIAELLPKHPIYIDLLPPDAARAVIGKPHLNSMPARMGDAAQRRLSLRRLCRCVRRRAAGALRPRPDRDRRISRPARPTI